MATNHLGEREYRTYSAWRNAVLRVYPLATIDGNRDIATALNGFIAVGEWDGETGTIYGKGR